MSDHIVVPGDKLHIITRRRFREDLRSHFAGEVISAQGAFCEIEGHAFVLHTGVNEFRRRPGVRTRFLSLADAGHIVNRIPRDVDLSSLQYRIVDKRLVVTDDGEFALDINEFGPMG